MLPPRRRLPGPGREHRRAGATLACKSDHVAQEQISVTLAKCVASQPAAQESTCDRDRSPPVRCSLRTDPAGGRVQRWSNDRRPSSSRSMPPDQPLRVPRSGLLQTMQFRSAQARVGAVPGVPNGAPARLPPHHDLPADVRVTARTPLRSLLGHRLVRHVVEHTFGMLGCRLVSVGGCAGILGTVAGCGTGVPLPGLVPRRGGVLRDRAIAASAVARVQRTASSRAPARAAAR